MHIYFWTRFFAAIVFSGRVPKTLATRLKTFFFCFKKKNGSGGGGGWHIHSTLKTECCLLPIGNTVFSLNREGRDSCLPFFSYGVHTVDRDPILNLLCLKKMELIREKKSSNKTEGSR